MKYMLTFEDNLIVSECYLKNKTIYECFLLVPHIKINSIKMKYKNCEYLNKNEGLNHCSKMHIEVWKNLKK